MGRGIFQSRSRRETVGDSFNEHVNVINQIGSVATIVIVLPAFHMRHVLLQPVVHKFHHLRHVTIRGKTTERRTVMCCLVVTQVLNAPESVMLNTTGRIICEQQTQ
jgi:hypothetical protein